MFADILYLFASVVFSIWFGLLLSPTPMTSINASGLFLSFQPAGYQKSSIGLECLGTPKNFFWVVFRFLNRGSGLAGPKRAALGGGAGPKESTGMPGMMRAAARGREPGAGSQERGARRSQEEPGGAQVEPRRSLEEQGGTRKSK